MRRDGRVGRAVCGLYALGKSVESAAQIRCGANRAKGRPEDYRCPFADGMNAIAPIRANYRDHRQLRIAPIDSFSGLLVYARTSSIFSGVAMRNAGRDDKAADQPSELIYHNMDTRPAPVAPFAFSSRGRARIP